MGHECHQRLTIRRLGGMHNWKSRCEFELSWNVELPAGGTIGLRTVATKSPGTVVTIDVNIPNIPITKIKINP